MVELRPREREYIDVKKAGAWSDAQSKTQVANEICKQFDEVRRERTELRFYIAVPTTIPGTFGCKKVSYADPAGWSLKLSCLPSDSRRYMDEVHHPECTCSWSVSGAEEKGSLRSTS